MPYAVVYKMSVSADMEGAPLKARRLYRIRLAIAGEVHEYYRRAASSAQARLIAIHTLETKLGFVSNALLSTFGGTKDNISVREVYVTKNNQIKEIM